MPASATLIHFPIALLLLLGSSHATQATSAPGLNRPDFMAELSTNSASSSLFNRAIFMAQAIADPLERIQALTSIARRLTEVHQPAKAKQIIDQVMQIAHRIPVESARNQYEASRQEEPFIAISAQIADAGFIDQALALVRSRISTKLNQGLALNKIAVAAARHGKTQQAKKLLSEAVRSIKGASEDNVYQSNGGCENDKFQAFSEIAKSLSLVSELDQALKVTESIWGCTSASGDWSQSYQAWAYLGILSQIETVQEVKIIWASAQRMPQNPKVIQDPIERASTWSAIAVKLIQLNEIPLALSIATEVSQIPHPQYEILGFPESQQLGLQEIAAAFAAKQQFEAALQVKDLIKNDFRKNLALRAIAAQLARAGKLPQALELANSISDATLRTKSKLLIVRNLNEMGLRAQAKTLFESLIPELTPEVAPELVAIEQSARALEFVAKLDPDKQASIILDTARQLIDVGQLESAQRLANMLKYRGEREDILRAIALRQIKLGQLDQALNLVLPLQDILTLRDPITRTSLLTSIAQGFARSGQSSKALQAATAISTTSDRVAAIAAIATD
jgi:tetratricopeptide (TPR) repeat protein